MAAVGNVIDVAGMDVSIGTGHGQSLPGMRLNVDDFLAPKSAPYASVEPRICQNEFQTSLKSIDLDGETRKFSSRSLRYLRCLL